jgi:hypothetical protein
VLEAHQEQQPLEPETLGELLHLVLCCLLLVVMLVNMVELPHPAALEQLPVI